MTDLGQRSLATSLEQMSETGLDQMSETGLRLCVHMSVAEVEWLLAEEVLDHRDSDAHSFGCRWWGEKEGLDRFLKQMSPFRLDSFVGHVRG